MDLRYLEVPVGALDTASDPTSLPPGALTQADNCSADTPGAYEHRKGYAALSTAGAPPGACVRLIKRGDELAALNGLSLYSYHEGGAVGWSNFSQMPPDALTTEATAELDQTSDQKVCSVAVANGMRVECWLTSAGVPVVQGVSVTDGSLVFRNSPVGIAAVYTTIRACAAGTTVVIMYGSPASTRIDYSTVDTTSAFPGASGPILITNTADATLAQFDMCPLNATDVLVAYKTSTPNVSVIRRNVVTSTTAAGPTAVSTENVDACLAVLGVTGEFGVILYHSTAAGGMRAACFNPSTTAQTVAPFSVEAVTVPLAVNCGISRVSAASYMAVWDRAPSGITKAYVQWRTISSAGAVGALTGPLRNVALASKPFTFTIVGNALQYANVWFGGSLQQTLFTVRLNTAASQPFAWPAAMHAYRTAWGTAPATNVLSDVATVSSGVFVYAGAIQYKFLSTSAARAGIKTFGIDMASALRFLFCEAAGLTVLCGGVGSYYDGRRVIETNFLTYPEITQATPGAVGAGGMDDGTYAYAAVFEFTDKQGNTHRSTTSVPVQAVTSAGAGKGKVTITIDDCTITRLTATVPGLVSLFRTTRLESGGSTKRFVGSAVLAGGAAVTIVDQANDSTILNNRVLYTDGGVLDREPPPPSAQLLLHRNRVWGISSADRKVLFYSGEIAVGEAPWFSSLQQVRIEAGGDITAIASMDDKLIVYKGDRIFKIYGSGMNALGQNNDLSLPTPINTDAGAIDPRSAVAMSDGTMYRNKKGIQILVRGEESGYIGAPVEVYVDAAANVTAAVLLADAREVRFELDTGKKVVFNYGTKRWTTHSNYQGSTAVDAIVVNGRYYWATAAGAVYQEKLSTDAGPYLDPASTYAPMTIEAAWLAPAGRQGLTRVQQFFLLAERLDPHDLTITTSVNYDTVTPPLVSPLTNATLAALPREQIRVSLTSQKLQSVRVKTVDAASSGGGATVTGQGYKLRGFGFMAGVKKGAFDKRMVNAAKV